MNESLREVCDHEVFFVNISDFKTIGKAKSLEELLDIIKISPCEVVTHHVREGRNDFADWISDVLHDQKLSNALKELKHSNTFQTQIAIINAIEQRIKELKETPS